MGAFCRASKTGKVLCFCDPVSGLLPRFLESACHEHHLEPVTHVSVCQEQHALALPGSLRGLAQREDGHLLRQAETQVPGQLPYPHGGGAGLLGGPPVRHAWRAVVGLPAPEDRQAHPDRAVRQAARHRGAAVRPSEDPGDQPHRGEVVGGAGQGHDLRLQCRREEDCHGLPEGQLSFQQHRVPCGQERGSSP